MPAYFQKKKKVILTDLGRIAATCQSNFEQGVALALHLWPVLTHAVQNSWGGPDSQDKRDWFAGAVVDLFPDLTKTSPSPSAPAPAAAQNGSANGPAGEPDVEYVEEFLLQVMVDEFEANVDDDSSLEVAEQIIKARAECLRGKFTEVDALRRRWEGRKNSKVVFKKGEDEDNETDWDTEEDDDDDDGDGDGDDVEMGDAPTMVSTKKEKEEPEVDEDGFTKVTRRKR